MPIDTRAIETILNAYAQGNQQRMLEEDRSIQRQQDSEKLKLAQTQFQEELKQRQEEFKLRQRSAEVAEQAHEFNLKKDLAERISKGLVPHNVQVQSTEADPAIRDLLSLPQVAENLRGAVTMGPVTVQGNEYSTPSEFGQTNPQLVQQRQQAEQRTIAQQALAEFNQSQMNQRHIESLQSREQQAALNRGARLQAASISASRSNANSGDSQKLTQLKEVDRIAKEAVGNNKVVQNYIVADDAYNHVKNLQDPNYAKKHNMSPGVADLEFLYAFAKAQDPNRVTEGEMELLKSATSDLEKLGFKIKGISQDKAFISPTVRKAAFDSIKRKKEQSFGRYQTLTTSQFQRAKKFDPDLTKEEFDSMIKLESGGVVPLMSKESASESTTPKRMKWVMDANGNPIPAN